MAIESANQLRRFVEDAAHNCGQAINLRGPVREYQEEADGIWVAIQGGAVHPNDCLLPAFCTRSHTSFRAALLLVWSGMVTEVYPSLRSCLENALYGLEATAKGKYRVWIDRAKSAQATKACKDAFKISDMWNTLLARDEELGNRCRDVYNHLIDLGGHPNAPGVLSSITTFTDQKIETATLMPGTGPWKVAMQFVAKTGILSLRVFQVTHPRIFERAGIEGPLKKLYKEFGHVKPYGNLRKSPDIVEAADKSRTTVEEEKHPGHRKTRSAVASAEETGKARGHKGKEGRK